MLSQNKGPVTESVTGLVYLPDKGDQSVFDFLLIFPVAGKFLFQQQFLVFDPPGNEQRVDQEDHKGMEGTQHQRHG